MARSYCSTTDVEKYLPANLTVGSSTGNFRNPNPANVSTTELDFFIEQASDYVDSAIATQYETPLKKTNSGGTVSYPNPIPQITSILAAQTIYAQKLQGADAQYSEAQKTRLEWAETQLARIQNGEIRLLGQRNTMGDRFVRGTIRNIPKNPTEGGKSGKN